VIPASYLVQVVGYQDERQFSQARDSLVSFVKQLPPDSKVTVLKAGHTTEELLNITVKATDKSWDTVYKLSYSDFSSASIVSSKMLGNNVASYFPLSRRLPDLPEVVVYFISSDTEVTDIGSYERMNKKTFVILLDQEEPDKAFWAPMATDEQHIIWHNMSALFELLEEGTHSNVRLMSRKCFKYRHKNRFTTYG